MCYVFVIEAIEGNEVVLVFIKFRDPRTPPQHTSMDLHDTPD